jgi:hypothetical protein
VQKIESKYLTLEESSPFKSNFNRMHLYLQRVSRALQILDAAGRTLPSLCTAK